MKVFLATSLIVLTCASSLFGQVEDFASTDFKKADSLAHVYRNHSLTDLRALAVKLTSPLSTEVEKFRAIYLWICSNIENDYALFQKNQHKREKLRGPEALKKWNKELNAVVFKTLLKEQKTICTGYAYLVRELAYHAGLTCVIVDGYGRTVQANIRGEGVANHSWNAVQLNNKWYLCDATWSSGSVYPELKKFIKKYDNAYFLAEPSLFIRNHYPLDTAWTLLVTKPTLQEFLNRPLIYGSIFPHKIDELLPETFDILTTKGNAVTFQFTRKSTTPLENVELLIRNSANVFTHHPQRPQSDSRLHSINHTFSAKGTYTVHILLNNEHAFTYMVKVQ